MLVTLIEVVSLVVYSENYAKLLKPTCTNEVQVKGYSINVRVVVVSVIFKAAKEAIAIISSEVKRWLNPHLVGVEGKGEEASNNYCEVRHLHDLVVIDYGVHVYGMAMVTDVDYNTENENG